MPASLEATPARAVAPEADIQKKLALLAFRREAVCSMLLALEALQVQTQETTRSFVILHPTVRVSLKVRLLLGHLGVQQPRVLRVP